ncbi:hypothetical protein QQF64_013705 [Cirrhinus molitorella]|uniref:Uncharacterized protein n=1 Tax=Cirrhinus molitorella TaxID=172907 RepID=A0ABR3LVF0_9TELE
MDTWLKTGTLKKSRDSRNETSTSASSMEMCSGLEYMEKSDRTDTEDNERDEEAQAGTEKSSRDVLMKRNRPTLESEKMSSLGASKNAQRASYLASYRIAKRGMPHTIGENLCLPVAKDMVNCMLGEKAAKTLDKIPLSDNTVARRIDSISADILSQLISRIKNSEFFSLQVDESTDVANLSNLLVRLETARRVRCEAVQTVGPGRQQVGQMTNEEVQDDNGLEHRRGSTREKARQEHRESPA